VTFDLELLLENYFSKFEFYCVKLVAAHRVCARERRNRMFYEGLWGECMLDMLLHGKRDRELINFHKCML